VKHRLCTHQVFGLLHFVEPRHRSSLRPDIVFFLGRPKPRPHSRLLNSSTYEWRCILRVIKGSLIGNRRCSFCRMRAEMLSLPRVANKLGFGRGPVSRHLIVIQVGSGVTLLAALYVPSDTCKQRLLLVLVEGSASTQPPPCG
jgi:hypothetical protein